MTQDCCGRRGSTALREAKAAHDAGWRAVYNPYVDFDGVRAQAALEAGPAFELAVSGKIAPKEAEKSPAPRKTTVRGFWIAFIR